MTNLICPSANQLSLLVSGMLPNPPADEVSEHVGQCESCARMLAVLPARDELASSIRRAAQVRQFHAPVLRKLRDELAKLPEKLNTLSATNDRTELVDRGKPKVEQELNLYLEPPQSRDEIGRLGSYRVLKVLGRGGMGVVLLAEDVALRRRVALKLMQSHLLADPDIVERFQREARATAAVRSDHVVAIFAVDEIKTRNGPVQYMSMEYLKGESLDARLKKGPLSTDEVLRYGAQIASGLAAVHECGLVHRDIKPGNLWLEPVTGPDGTITRAKLLDFGLAHAGLEVSVLTQFGTVIGTPAYMSPEQASGKEVDARSDLFSLGAVMYEMLTGRKPFRGPNTMAVLMALAGEAPPSPSELSQAIPQPLSDFVMMLLQKSPSARPMTALAVVEQLRSLRKELRGRAPASKLRPSEPVPANEPPAKPAQPVARAKPVKTTPSRTPDAANATPHITADEPAKPTSAKPAKPTANPREKLATKPRGLSPTLVRLIATVLAGGLVIWLGALLLRVQTPHGTLVIESEDENVEVRVKKNGATIIDHTKDRKLKLEVGEYGIELVNKIDGLKLSAEKITITREGQPPIFIRRETPAETAQRTNASGTPVANSSQSPGSRKMDDPAIQKMDALAGTDTPKYRRFMEWIKSRGGSVAPEVTVNGELPHIVSLPSNKPFTDEDFEHFRDLPGVQNVLGISSPNLSTIDMIKLGRVMQGKPIGGGTGLVDTPVGLDWLREPGGFAAGTRFTFQNIDARNEQLAALRNLPNLTQLNLRFNKDITDAGIVHLEGLKQLRHLHIDGTGITEAGLIRLRKALPDCEITPAVKVSRIGLDPQAIPESERFPWQPKGLMGVIGTQRRAHWGSVFSVALSPDGKQFLSSGEDGFWFEATAGQPAQYILSADNPAYFVSHHETLGFLSVHRDGQVFRWFAETPARRELLWRVHPETRALRVSHDAKTLVAWVVPGAAPDNTFEGHYPLGETVVFDVVDDSPRERFRIRSTRHPALSPQGNLLFLYDEDAKELQAFDLQKPQASIVSRIKCDIPIWQMEYGAENRIVSMNTQSLLEHWSTNAGDLKRLDSIDATSRFTGLIAMAVSGNGQRVVAPRVHGVRTFDIVEDKFRPYLTGDLMPNPFLSGFERVALSQDGSILLTGPNGAQVRRWTLEPDKATQDDFQGYVIGTPLLTAAGDGSRVAFLNSWASIRIWGLDQPQPEYRKNPEWNHAIVLALNDDGKAACVSAGHAELSLFREIGDTWLTTKLLDLNGQAASFSGDSRLAVGTVEGEVVLYDIKDRQPNEIGRLSSLGPDIFFHHMAFQRDVNRLIAITSPKKSPRELSLRVFDINESKLREAYTKKMTDVMSSLSRFGSHVSLAYRDGLVEVFEIGPTNWKKSGELHVGVNPVSIDLSPTGSQLVTVGPPREVRVWGTENASLMKRWELPGRVWNAIVLGSSGCIVTANSNMTGLVLRVEGPDVVAQKSDPVSSPIAATPARSSRVGLTSDAIPEAERFPRQPQELVGVIGSHELTHWKPVSSVAANGDGTALLSTGDDGIWAKPALDRPAVYFPGRENYAISTLWHGQLGFLTVHRDGVIKRWLLDEPVRSEKQWQLPADTRLIRLSTDGRVLVAWVVPGTTWYDLYKLPHCIGEAIVFDVDGQELKERFQVPRTGPPAITPTGRWLTYHNVEAKQVERRDATAPDAPIISRQTFASPVRYVETPHEDRLVTQTVDQQLQWWDVGGNEFRELSKQILTGHSGDYTGLSVSKDGSRIALVRFGSNQFDVCDVNDDQLKSRPMIKVECNSGMHAGVISPNGEMLVGGSDMGCVRYLHLRGDKVEFDQHRGYELLSERYTKLSSGPNLMSAGDGSMIGMVHSAPRGERWSLRGTVPEKLPPPVGDDPYQRPISAISDDGTLALVPGLRMERDLWRVTDGAQSATALPDQLQAMRAGFSDDGRLIAATTKGELVIYDVSTRLVEKRAQSESLGLQTTVWSVAFQRGSSRVVAITHPTKQRRELTLRVFDVQDKTIRELYSKSLSNVSVALSRHGHHLAVAYPDGIVEHYEIQSAMLKKRGEVKLTSPAVALDISATGDRLLTSGPEHEVRIWNTADGKQVRLWQLPGRVYEAIFADSEHVVTANANMTAYILAIDGP